MKNPLPMHPRQRLPAGWRISFKGWFRVDGVMVLRDLDKLTERHSKAVYLPVMTAGERMLWSADDLPYIETLAAPGSRALSDSECPSWMMMTNQLSK